VTGIIDGPDANKKETWHPFAEIDFTRASHNEVLTKDGKKYNSDRAGGCETEGTLKLEYIPDCHKPTPVLV
jgi:hypothetical protein